jgi:hypothetical protein
LYHRIAKIEQMTEKTTECLLVKGREFHEEMMTEIRTNQLAIEEK